MTGSLDFDAHIARESVRFAAALESTASDARVPTCPDWDADDLWWHLGSVQAFWASIVRDRILDAPDAGRDDEARPADRAGIRAYFAEASQGLQSALRAVADDRTPAWTWAPDHTVGFIRRRQAHEALIHRVDAEVAAGARTPMDAPLCVDGVIEVLSVMYGGAPGWGSFTPDEGRTVRLIAADADVSWVVALGRFTGVDTDDDTAVDEPDIRVLADGSAAAAASISATAADLDCWLWHRPTIGTIEQSGDPGVLAAFGSIIAQPIN